MRVGGKGPPPNFLVVVMDCMRATDFVGDGPEDGIRAPFLRALRRESRVFPRAVSPASWTLPSHASLLTGLYPWENGVHGRSSVHLQPSVPTLASRLRNVGYTSFSLSANMLICPEMGLDPGFQQMAWGGWWEPYLRFLSPPEPPGTTGESRPEVGGIIPFLRRGPLWRLMHPLAQFVLRHPWCLDAFNRVGHQVTGPEGPFEPEVCRWIESSLRAHLRRLAPTTPFFTFVNLLESHEPYFWDARSDGGLLGWMRYARMRQDRMGWMAGEWAPTAEENRVLHALYRKSVEALDRRIGSMVSVLKEAGRWESTHLFLTSDHGQAFGEHGALFHMLRVDDPIVRIPLWHRDPGGADGGGPAQGWASLIDIAPTLLEAAGASTSGLPSAVPLSSLVDREREGPVLTMSDGCVASELRRPMPRARMDQLDRVLVAGYQGNLKLVHDAKDRTFAAYDVQKDPGETRDILPEIRGRLPSLRTEVERVATRLLGRAPESVSADVQDRLRAWGYL